MFLHNPGERQADCLFGRKRIRRHRLSRTAANGQLAGCPASGALEGSLTVEASVAMPFLVLIIGMGLLLVRLLGFQWTVQKTLEETALEVSRRPEAVVTEAAVVAEARIRLSSSEGMLPMVLGGVLGLDMSESSVTEERVILSSRYVLKLPFRWKALRLTSFSAKAEAVRWTGDHKNTQTSEESAEEEVYVTPTGVAWHRTTECVYLSPRLSAVPLSSLSQRRSEDGSIYTPCSACGASASGTVYVAAYGEVYHSSVSCETLKRTIRKIPLSEAGAYHPCPKCAGSD